MEKAIAVNNRVGRVGGGGSGSERPALYYFSPCYRQAEARVILLVGTSWRPNLRAHYGIDVEPFFSRAAYDGEPDHYPNRHPWGWVFRPEKVLPYEIASGRMTEADLQRLKKALEEQLAALPFAGADAISEALESRASQPLIEVHA